MIQRMTSISPTLSLKLVSPRLLVKKTMAYYPTAAGRDELVEAAMQTHSENRALCKSLMAKATADVTWRISPKCDDCDDRGKKRTCEPITT